MSILTIYQTHLTPERNALVDELDWYLENEAIQTFKFEEFQYQKLGLNLSLVIPADQENITNQTLGNYLTIQQDDETWYYFIVSYGWTSRKAITINAIIDSVNTFRDKVEGSRKTTITRQHEDRFFITENAMLQRNIDEMAEGIETTKYILKDRTIQQNEDELDWYFIYKTKEELTTNESTPFDCFLCAGQPISFDSGDIVAPVVPGNLDNKYEYIFSTQNPGATIRINCPITGHDITTTDTALKYVQLGRPMIVVATVGNGTTYLGVKFFKMILTDLCIFRTLNETRVYCRFSDGYTEYGQDENYGDITFLHHNGDFSDTDMPVFVLQKAIQKDEIAIGLAGEKKPDMNGSFLVSQIGYNAIVQMERTVLLSDIRNWSDVEKGVYDSEATFQDYYTTGRLLLPINGINEVNKTDTRLMKIMRLPYCPVPYQRTGPLTYRFTSEWIRQKVETIATDEQTEAPSIYLLQLQDYELNKDFKAAVGSIDIDDILTCRATIAERLSNSERNMNAESKLFSSEFRTPMFIYDSFTKGFAPEQFKPEGGTYTGYWSLPITYKQTNTINSNFLFDLGYKELTQSNPHIKLDYKKFDNYEQILIVKRNNEEALYNSDYLNYMRTGYNYDKKRTDENITQGWIGAALSFLGAGAQGALGVSSYVRRYKDYNRIYGWSKAEPAVEMYGQVIKEAKPSQGEYPHWSAEDQARFRTNRANAIGGMPGLIIGQAAINAANGITNLINQGFATSQAYRALEQQKLELSAKATGVSGSDDIDLLKYYNDNRLHYIIFDTVELQKKAAHNLFHYCGYARAKQAVPNFTGRYWFNYIQCSPLFKGEELHPYNAFLNDIKARYEAGLTVYHRHYNAAGAGQSYDGEQEFENGEDNVVYEKYTTDMLTFFGTTMRQRLTYKGPEIDNYYAWIEVEDADGNSLLNTKDTEGNITYGQEWSFTGAARVRINTRQPEQASDWLTIGG